MYSNSGINRVFLAGTISKEPRWHKVAGKGDILSFQLTTHEQFSSAGKLTDHYETHFVKATESVLSFPLKRDQLVHVEGKIHTEAFTDAGNVRRYRTEIIATRIMPLASAEPDKAMQAATKLAAE